MTACNGAAGVFGSDYVALLPIMKNGVASYFPVVSVDNGEECFTIIIHGLQPAYQAEILPVCQERVFGI